MSSLIKVVIPEKISTNPFYNLAFYEKTPLKKHFYQETKVAVMNQKVQPVQDYPVQAHYTFYLKGKKLDWVNLASMTKMVEDGLVKAKVLTDDSPKYVIRGTMESRPLPKDEKLEYCLVELTKPQS